MRTVTVPVKVYLQVDDGEVSDHLFEFEYEAGLLVDGLGPMAYDSQTMRLRLADAFESACEHLRSGLDE